MQNDDDDDDDDEDLKLTTPFEGDTDNLKSQRHRPNDEPPDLVQSNPFQRFFLTPVIVTIRKSDTNENIAIHSWKLTPTYFRLQHR